MMFTEAKQSGACQKRLAIHLRQTKQSGNRLCGHIELQTDIKVSLQISSLGVNQAIITLCTYQLHELPTSALDGIVEFQFSV